MIITMTRKMGHSRLSRREALGLILALWAATPNLAAEEAVRREYTLVVLQTDHSPLEMMSSQLSTLASQLNSVAGPLFEPALSFTTRTLETTVLDAFVEADSHHLDFFISVDPTVAACIESEFRFAPLLTVRRLLPGATEDVSEGGSVLVALKMGRIKAIKDLHDAVVAAPSMSIIYQHAFALEAHNVSIITTAAQVRVLHVCIRTRQFCEGHSELLLVSQDWVDVDLDIQSCCLFLKIRRRCTLHTYIYINIIWRRCAFFQTTIASLQTCWTGVSTRHLCTPCPLRG